MRPSKQIPFRQVRPVRLMAVKTGFDPNSPEIRSFRQSRRFCLATENSDERIVSAQNASIFVCPILRAVVLISALAPRSEVLITPALCINVWTMRLRIKKSNGRSSTGKAVSKLTAFGCVTGNRGRFLVFAIAGCLIWKIGPLLSGS